MRKEILLGTSALIAGALAAPDFAAGEEPLRLDVRGYKQEYFGFGDVDTPSGVGDFNGTGEFSDGEIQFRGETALDNGLTVGVQVEMETDSRGDQIDENYVFIKGDFGKIVAGSENLSVYNTFWGVTAPGVGVPMNSGWHTVWIPAPTGYQAGFLSTIGTTNIDIGNDENSISYYSPRFSGFQFTTGYAPTVVDSGEGKTFSGLWADEDAQFSNGWGVGMNFSESFNGVDVAFAVGYNQVEAPANVEAAGGDDVQQFKIGARIGAGGFSVGGSYANEFEGKYILDETGGVARNEEGESWDAGISYGTGPWGVSATYFHGEWDATLGGGDDETDTLVGAVSYALGPGVKTSLSLVYGKFEDELGPESEVTIGVLGITVSF